MNSEQDFAARLEEIDARFRARLQNQIDSINCILKGGTYDDEMDALHAALAAAQAQNEALGAIVEGLKMLNTLVVDDTIVTVPLSREAQHALQDVTTKHRSEFNAALAPFGLTVEDIIQPTYERVLTLSELRDRLDSPNTEAPGPRVITEQHVDVTLTKTGQ